MELKPSPPPLISYCTNHADCHKHRLRVECRVAVCRSVLQWVAACCGLLQWRVVVRCSVLLVCVADVCCSVLQRRVAVCLSVLSHMSTNLSADSWANKLQCVAVCCTVLQCVALLSPMSPNLSADSWASTPANTAHTPFPICASGHTSESDHTHEWVTSHTCMSHVKQMIESSYVQSGEDP